MKKYTKPEIIEEVLVLEDIISMSFTSNGGDDDTDSWTNIFPF